MTKLCTSLVAILLATACQQQAEGDSGAGTKTILAVTTVPASDSPAAPADRPLPAPRASTVPSSDSTTVLASDKSPEAAKKLVEEYFAALDERRFADAYRAYGSNAGSAAELARNYVNYRSFVAAVGTPGTTEGGAGSIYIEIPVVVTGTTRDGAPFRLEGPVALRRVNDVDGSTDEQRRWHIFSTDLKPRR